MVSFPETDMSMDITEHIYHETEPSDPETSLTIGTDNPFLGTDFDPTFLYNRPPKPPPKPYAVLHTEFDLTTFSTNLGHPFPNPVFDKTLLFEQSAEAEPKIQEVLKREINETMEKEWHCHSHGYDFIEVLSTATNSQEFSLEDRLADLKTILDGLKWRFQIQQRFILIWDELVRCNLLSKDCIMRSMNARGDSESVRLLVHVIHRFEYMYKLGHCCSRRTARGSLRGEFDEPILWLATLIARCGTGNLGKVFGWLEVSKYLGDRSEDPDIPEKYDLDIFKPFKPYEMSIVDILSSIEEQEPDQYVYENCLDPGDKALGESRIGFILPHGQNIREWANFTAKRYEDVKDDYESMCGAGSWEIDPHFIATMRRLTQWVPPVFETVLKSKVEEDAERQCRLFGQDGQRTSKRRKIV